MAAPKQFEPKVGAWQSVIPSAAHPSDPLRYHLYAAYFCPFAHRVLLSRALKGLEAILPLTIVLPFPKDARGWVLPSDASQYPGSSPDPLYHASFLSEIYFRSPPTYKEYEGKFSVPVLWDKQAATIVNNESEQISRFLNTAFNEHLEGEQRERNFYPEHLRPQIDEVNAWLVPHFNAGVYKAVAATNQEEYETAARAVYDSLDKMEAMLVAHGQLYLLGSDLTELDLKAYATLIRFDTAYANLFKLNWKTIRGDYPRLHRYMKYLYWKVPGFKETTDFKHIKEGYFKALNNVNPGGLTPMGPDPHIESWTEEDERWLQSIQQ